MQVGLDTSPAMVERFNAKASAGGLANMRGICADVLRRGGPLAQLASQQLPQQFDLLVSLMTPHHLEQLEEVTAALGRLLRPGTGALVYVDILKTGESG
jgi:SAM-dependent methyltransferase